MCIRWSRKLQILIMRKITPCWAAKSFESRGRKIYWKFYKRFKKIKILNFCTCVKDFIIKSSISLFNFKLNVKITKFVIYASIPHKIHPPKCMKTTKNFKFHRKTCSRLQFSLRIASETSILCSNSNWD